MPARAERRASRVVGYRRLLTSVRLSVSIEPRHICCLPDASSTDHASGNSRAVCTRLRSRRRAHGASLANAPCLRDSKHPVYATHRRMPRRRLGAAGLPEPVGHLRRESRRPGSPLYSTGGVGRVGARPIHGVSDSTHVSSGRGQRWRRSRRLSCLRDRYYIGRVPSLGAGRCWAAGDVSSRNGGFVWRRSADCAHRARRHRLPNVAGELSRRPVDRRSGGSLVRQWRRWSLGPRGLQHLLAQPSGRRPGGGRDATAAAPPGA